MAPGLQSTFLLPRLELEFQLLSRPRVGRRNDHGAWRWAAVQRPKNSRTVANMSTSQIDRLLIQPDASLVNIACLSLASWRSSAIVPTRPELSCRGKLSRAASRCARLAAQISLHAFQA
jgi:hypothetical protein